MSKGLDLILEKIKASPSQTLISRYLALIAELPVEADKTRRALDLAVVLVQPKPAEAMRIAHMVFSADQRELRALDVLIDSLEVRGRYAKAEVLRLEKEKIQKALADGRSPEATSFDDFSLSDGAGADPGDARPTLKLAEGFSPGLAVSPAMRSPVVAAGQHGARDFHQANQAPARDFHAPVARDQQAPAQNYHPPVVRDQQAPVAPRGGYQPDPRAHHAPGVTRSPQPGAVEMSRIAELDLGGETNVTGALAQLFPADPKAPVYKPDIRADRIEGGAVELLAGFARGGAPGDTVLPMGRAVKTAGNEAQTVALNQAVRATAADVPMSRYGAVLELFDYYWRQGFVGEARDLLRQTASLAGHEPWWQARNALLEKSKLAPIQRAPEPTAASDTMTKPLTADEFWKPLQAEIGQLARAAKTLLVPATRVDRLRTLLHATPRGQVLPEVFVRSLAELDHRLPGLDAPRLLALKWELLQGLWGAAPDAACAAVLEELGLARATPGFWGLYLDSLLAAGGARRVLVEIRRALAEKPHLVWARIAWTRLPIVWTALKVYGFLWTEDDGVAALLAKLSERPRPKLAAMIAAPMRGG